MLWHSFSLLSVLSGAAMSPKNGSQRVKSVEELSADISSNCELNSSDFKKLDMLGGGQFAPVYMSEHEAMPVAIKEVGLKPDELHLGMVLNEMVALKAIRAAGNQAPEVLLRLKGFYWNKNFVGMVTEFLDGMDLDNGIKVWQMRQCDPLATKHPYSEPLIAKIMASVLEGLVYLHNNSWIHCDVKPANIMITSEGNVKLIDFGLACPGPFTHKTGCSPNYAAPELLMYEGHGPKYDIWSLAATAFELHTGTRMIQLIPGVDSNFKLYLTQKAMRKMIEVYIVPAIPRCLDWASANLTNFILGALIIDPTARPSAKDLIQDSFVTVDLATKEDIKSCVANLRQ